MKLRSAAVVAGLALGLMSGTARAAFLFDYQQETGGVLESASGSFDLSAASFSNNTTFPSYTNSSIPITNIGTGMVSLYEAVFINSQPFGTDSDVFGTGSGQFVGFAPAAGFHTINVPVGYISGSAISGTSAFYSGATLSSLGLKNGTFTYDYETSTGLDSIVVQVGTVPLPASAPMFGAALLGLAGLGYGLKRKGKAAASA